jgi:hypothetical protein
MKRVAPEIRGIVLRDGKPEPGYVLFRSRSLSDQPCKQVDLEVITSDDGTFVFPRKKVLVPVASMMDAMYRVSLCSATESQFLWSAGYFPGVPDQVECLVCELSEVPAAGESCVTPEGECPVNAASNSSLTRRVDTPSPSQLEAV